VKKEKRCMKINKELHVVLGASGTIGQAVVSELKLRNLNIRAVERRKKITDVETVNADLLDLNQTINAVKGATYVYLCIGIPYNAKAWLEEWPKVMGNVITACESANARLIFLDNVYMYGPAPLKAPFDESHTQNPPSQKGKARKMTASMLMEAHNAGRVKAVIGRSADFYGPNAVNSPFYISFLERMLAGRNPLSIGRIDVKHTYAYSLDNGRALVALALDDETYGQVWHLPVSEPVTVEEVLAKFNKVMGTAYKVAMIPRLFLGILGVFISPIKELKEMLYQFDYPYIMSYSKFKNHFPDFKVTALEDGIKATVDSFKQ